MTETNRNLKSRPDASKKRQTKRAPGTWVFDFMSDQWDRPIDRVVFCYLLRRYSQKTQRAQIKQKTIATEQNISARTITRSVNRLERAGLLQVTRNKNRTNVYKFPLVVFEEDARRPGEWVPTGMKQGAVDATVAAIGRRGSVRSSEGSRRQSGVYVDAKMASPKEKNSEEKEVFSKENTSLGASLQTAESSGVAKLVKEEGSIPSTKPASFTESSVPSFDAGSSTQAFVTKSAGTAGAAKVAVAARTAVPKKLKAPRTQAARAAKRQAYSFPKGNPAFTGGAPKAPAQGCPQKGASEAVGATLALLAGLWRAQFPKCSWAFADIDTKTYPKLVKKYGDDTLLGVKGAIRFWESWHPRSEQKTPYPTVRALMTPGIFHLFLRKAKDANWAEQSSQVQGNTPIAVLGDELLEKLEAVWIKASTETFGSATAWKAEEKAALLVGLNAKYVEHLAQDMTWYNRHVSHAVPNLSDYLAFAKSSVYGLGASCNPKNSAGWRTPVQPVPVLDGALSQSLRAYRHYAFGPQIKQAA